MYTYWEDNASESKAVPQLPNMGYANHVQTDIIYQMVNALSVTQAV